MQLYSYTAVSSQGERSSGQESARDEKELAEHLRERGLVLIFAKAQGGQGQQKFGNFLQALFGVSLEDKLIFIRNLKVMVAAGVPLPKALDVLSEQAGNKTFKKALAGMKEKIMQGTMLSEAMGGYPRIFSELFVNMVKAGEESGTLENVLSQLTLQLEKQHELRSKIIGALMYPAVIVVAMMAIGVIMIVTVVPQLTKTFAEFGADLPLTTQLVIGFSRFLINFWYLALGIVVGSIVGIIVGLRTASGKRAASNLTLSLPLISELVRKTNSATMLRTLSSLIASGIPIVKALEITANILSNGNFREALQKSGEGVRRGAKLSDSLSAYHTLYPPLVVQMVAIGEETGQSAEVLGKLAEFYEDEVSQMAQNLASLLEPLLMLLVGGVVGFFAVSMLSPMYSILGSIK